MQALIHITIAAQPIFSYQLPLLNWVKQQPFEVVCFDFDNHSEATLTTYAIQLLDQADKVLIVIENEAPSSPKNSIIKLMNKAVHLKNKEIKAILNGSDPMLERMGNVLGETNFYTNQTMEEQQTLCKTFFRN